MDIKLYDVVKLITGETACIVHIYEQGVAYVADIDKFSGTTETAAIKHEEIESIIPHIKPGDDAKT